MGFRGGRTLNCLTQNLTYIGEKTGNLGNYSKREQTLNHLTLNLTVHKRMTTYFSEGTPYGENIIVYIAQY